MTIDQRNQLMITICELLYQREIGVAADSSDVSALVAARRLRLLARDSRAWTATPTGQILLGRCRRRT
jgi:hypothetical protein